MSGRCTSVKPFKVLLTLLAERDRTGLPLDSLCQAFSVFFPVFLVYGLTRSPPSDRRALLSERLEQANVWIATQKRKRNDIWKVGWSRWLSFRYFIWNLPLSVAKQCIRERYLDKKYNRLITRTAVTVPNWKETYHFLVRENTSIKCQWVTSGNVKSLVSKTKAL